VAALAAGTLYAWPSVLRCLPSLFPFALFGVRRRSWWVALAASASRRHSSRCVDFITAIGNASNPNGLAH
jgi:hypothetical protein